MLDSLVVKPLGGMGTIWKPVPYDLPKTCLNGDGIDFWVNRTNNPTHGVNLLIRETMEEKVSVESFTEND